MKKVVLYKSLFKKSVKCLACSWYCKIADNRLGICTTRYNKNGVLYSLVYGKAIGLHLDPVEKKPLYHFLPGSKILSFGTLGCNFGCLFCQNWEMSQINKVESLKLKVESLLELIDQVSKSITPREIVGMALKLKADGIAYTYNEPAIFVEFACDTAKIARKNGLKNIYISNGFESRETFNYLKKYLDAINIDFKSFRGEFYQKICKGKIEPVLKNIKLFFSSGIETEITTLIIPNHNNTQNELIKISNFLASVSKDLPWHVSAFSPSYQMLNTSPTPHQTLIDAYQIGKNAGLKYVYVGNVLDDKRSSTYCPKCNKILVFRSGYHILIKNLNQQGGICKNCGEKIYGVWRN